MSSIPPLGENDPAAEPHKKGSSAETARPRRPRYLALALLVALFFAAGCFSEGCHRLGFYESDIAVGVLQDAVITDETDRGRLDGMYQHFLDEAKRQEGRAVPIAAAMFVLGAALFVVTSRGMSGRSNTRNLVMQLVAAQALVVGLGFWATRAMDRAELDWQTEWTRTFWRETMPPERFAQIASVTESDPHLWPPTWIAIRSIASMLVIIALTRPRARAFFDAAATPPLPE